MLSKITHSGLKKKSGFKSSGEFPFLLKRCKKSPIDGDRSVTRDREKGKKEPLKVRLLKLPTYKLCQ